MFNCCFTLRGQMRRTGALRGCFAAGALILSIPIANAGTLTVGITRTDGSGVVPPGGSIEYEIRGFLTDGDNIGLALFLYDIEIAGPGPINLGSAAVQSPGAEMAPFYPNLGYAFEYNGTIAGDELAQAGGAQNTLRNNPAAPPFLPFPSGTVVEDIGHDPAGVVLHQGVLTPPIDATLGTYTLRIKAGSLIANEVVSFDGTFYVVESAAVAISGEATFEFDGAPPQCTVAGDCADGNDDQIRDDNCRSASCGPGTCLGTNTLFADLGGVNGNCTPDGSTDANDKFHALNCFSDTNFGSPGEYPCEPDGPVVVYNVDAGGAGLTCCPDGACDANDAFAALNAFSGTSLCSICPQDTAICVGGSEPGIPCGNDASCPGGSCVIQNAGSHPCPPGGPSPVHMPPPVGHATITASADHRTVQSGELVSVNVFMDNAQRDLRGYQLHLSVTGGLRGRLDLVDISVRDRADHVFASAGYFDAFNVRTGQMIAGLDAEGVTTAKNGYLATYTYRASNDAAGAFVVDVMGYAPANPDRRTFLFASGNGTIGMDGAKPAVVVVARPRAATLR